MLLGACVVALCCLATAAHATWDAQAFSRESTLELQTVDAEEGPHWSTVWLVVIDGQLYVRLGSRATGRMQRNTTKPYVKVRVAGQEFDRVLAQIEPNMVDAVAKAMADKYWADVLMRHFDHPMTMRLTPAEGHDQ
jgi:hypothetical protein